MKARRPADLLGVGGTGAAQGVGWVEVVRQAGNNLGWRLSGSGAPALIVGRELRHTLPGWDRMLATASPPVRLAIPSFFVISGSSTADS